MANIIEPKTLQDAIVYFSDPERAFVYAVNLRWPDGIIYCPRCSGTSHSFVKTRLLWFCKGCKRQFTVKVGTIFEDSPITLDKWMTAVWMVCNCKNGVSSYEIARSLGITQKSAWFMLHRVREALANRTFGGKRKVGGSGSEVEVDETFVGGLTKNMHRSRAKKYSTIGVHSGKTIVQGFLDRDLRKIRATVVPNTKRETLQDEVLSNVKYGTTVYSDNAVGYDNLRYRFVHEFVNHAERYVNGRVHTNGLENFWSLLKRGLKGTYVAVEPFHLYRYVDEQVFRYNNRKTPKQDVTDADRFRLAMHQINGKRLTYAELTGKGTDSLHTSTTGAGQTEEPF
jgi:transposase-like protein